MSAKSDLKHSIINILKHNKDGSFKTQAVRKERLLLVVEQLAEDGYKIRHIRQLQLKHVKFLVNRWLVQGLSAGTIKNRMTDLRWVMEKVGKESMIPQSNAKLNIPKRQYVTHQDKSIELSEGDLSKITDMNTKLSLILQREFGLRREESIKIRINQAVVGNECLQGSWAKNGRPRKIKIIYPSQWQAIKQVKAFVGKSRRALIPDDKKYVQQEDVYDNQLKRAGIYHAHGLRYGYTQKRYEDLTGFPCPAKGGPLKSEMTDEQLKLDEAARKQISSELGHNRISVLKIYCS